MKFYKKNPILKHPVTVQGTQMGESTIVCGEEYAPFASVHTFPGWTPKLVEVSFDTLNEEQQQSVRSFAEKKGVPAPRHLGITTSSSIQMVDMVPKRMESLPDITKTKPRRIPQHVDVPAPVSEKSPPKSVKQVIAEKTGEQLPLLRDMYTPEECVAQFPGITEFNVHTVLQAFDTLDDLMKARKAEMRVAGISPTYSTRLRRAARRAKEDYVRKA